MALPLPLCFEPALASCCSQNQVQTPSCLTKPPAGPCRLSQCQRHFLPFLPPEARPWQPCPPSTWGAPFTLHSRPVLSGPHLRAALTGLHAPVIQLTWPNCKASKWPFLPQTELTKTRMENDSYSQHQALTQGPAHSLKDSK